MTGVGTSLPCELVRPTMLVSCDAPTDSLTVCRGGGGYDSSTADVKNTNYLGADTNGVDGAEARALGDTSSHARLRHVATPTILTFGDMDDWSTAFLAIVTPTCCS